MRSSTMSIKRMLKIYQLHLILFKYYANILRSKKNKMLIEQVMKLAHLFKFKRKLIHTTIDLTIKLKIFQLLNFLPYICRRILNILNKSMKSG